MNQESKPSSDLPTGLQGVSVDFDPFAGVDDAVTIEQVLRPTEAQREVWLADQLGREASLAYNEAVEVQLKGTIDDDVIARLQRACEQVLAAHQSLRAVFSADGSEMLIQSPAAVSLPFEVIDLRNLDADTRARRLRDWRTQVVQIPFNLTQGPLFRVHLIRLSDDEAALLLSAHHLVCDGYSFGIVLRDLCLAYSGKPLAPSAYADYVRAERRFLKSSEATDNIRFWTALYAQDVPVTDLPTDHPRPARRQVAAGRVDHLIGQPTVQALRQTASRLRVSLFTLLLGGFELLMSRLTGSTDVVVGVPAAGQVAADLPDIVGHCVNLLPIRGQVQPQAPTREWMSTVQQALFDAFDHQRFTFGSLLTHLPLSRDPSRLPLVSVMFNLDQRMDPALLRMPGLSVQVEPVARRFENFELFVNLTPLDEGIRAECQYSTALFDEATVRHWLQSFDALLQGIAENDERPVQQQPALTAQQQALLKRWNESRREPGLNRTAVDVFDRIASAQPRKIALSDGRHAISYQTLQDSSQRLAGHLQSRGVGPGALVGLCVERGVPMVIAQWAIWRTGAAYVPLDPAFPQERLAYMADDAGLALVVADDSTLPVCDGFQWPRDKTWVISADDLCTPMKDDERPAARLNLAAPEAAAYVIYTSGSTGKPKGVAVPHRAAANLLLSMARKPGIRSGDRLLAVTTLSFDIALLELMTPLIAGGTVHVASREDTMDGHQLAELLAREHITVMQATPGTWRLLLAAGWTPPEGFRALVGGEPLPLDLAKDLTALPLSLWNMYGPTETTVWSTCIEVRNPEAGISIGRPIDNTHVRVVDEAGMDVPFGAAGEILIGGEGVAIGYLGRPELTEDRFVPDAWSPGRTIYRTGDSGRWRHDGTLEHLGRLDHQVKVRGYRIELGEIESVLTTFPGVAQVVTLVREDTPGDQRLVAYLVAEERVPSVREATRQEASSLRAHLRKQLPDYMVPQHFVWMPAFTLLPNGKIDRKVMPRPDRMAGARDKSLAPAAAEAPATERQQRVARLMAEHLKLPSVGLDDDFFAMGGHSLLAAQLLLALGRELGTHVPLATIFEAPTARRLDAWLAGHSAEPAPTAADALTRRADRDSAPLSVMQQRLYFLEMVNPDTPVYNTPSAHRLVGPLDEAAFERAFNQLIARQPVLRTWIGTGPQGMPVQRIEPELSVSLFPAIDISHLPGDEQEAALKEMLHELVEEPIGTGTAPLFQTQMFRLSAHEHVWFFMPHHIIWDGWSFDLLYQEMSALYSREIRHPDAPAALPELAVDYGDFAVWHNQHLKTEGVQRQIDHWLSRIDREQPPLDLPADRDRPERMSGRGSTEWLHLPPELVRTVQDQARAHHSTAFMTLLGVWALLLHGVSKQPALTIGTPVRGRESPELEAIMGFFVNALPLNFRLDDGATVGDWMQQVRSVVVDAFAHTDVPADRLLQALGTTRDESRPPLWQAFFSYQEASARQLNWGSLEDRPFYLLQPGTAEDVGLWFLTAGDRLTGGLQYNTDIFDADRIRRLGKAYQLLLARWVDASINTPLTELLAVIPDSLLAAGPQDDPVFDALPLPGEQAAPAPDEAAASATGRQDEDMASPVATTSEGLQAHDDAAELSASPVKQAVEAQPASQAAAMTAAPPGQESIPVEAPSDAAASGPVAADTISGQSLPAASPEATAGAADDAGFTTMEKQLAAVWAELLGTDDIRADDNFFDLGGHSMLVMQAIAQMEAQTGRRVNPRRFIFETLAQVARAYEEATPEEAAPARKKSGGLMSRLKGAFHKRS
ncbi:MAG: amino acid adenylation domain-containing protein [Lautropia sp.]|nr:amino acid adenylation domain-containing protein [Lautropia sp.]